MCFAFADHPTKHPKNRLRAQCYVWLIATAYMYCSFLIANRDFLAPDLTSFEVEDENAKNIERTTKIINEKD